MAAFWVYPFEPSRRPLFRSCLRSRSHHKQLAERKTTVNLPLEILVLTS